MTTTSKSKKSSVKPAAKTNQEVTVDVPKSSSNPLSATLPIAAAILAVGLYYVHVNRPVVNPVNPDPVPSPTGRLEQVIAASTDKTAVKDLGKLYAAFADVVSRSQPISSSQLRRWMTSSDAFFVQGTDRVGKVPGFGAAKDEDLSNTIGLEDKMLSPEEMAKFVAFCKRVSAACGVKP